MIILGIDPGLATMGFGVVEWDKRAMKPVDFGVVTTPPHTPLPSRLKSLYEGVAFLLDTHQPDAVAVEELFFSKNVTTGITVAQARGVALLAAELVQAPVFEYKPMQVKLAVTGYGAADKKQVQDMIRMLLGLRVTPKPDDAADALAIAVCHAQSSVMKNIEQTHRT